MIAAITNWKTTAAGLIGAAIELYAHGAGWKQILVATAIAVLGILAKDFNTAVGRKPEPPQPELPSVVADKVSAAITIRDDRRCKVCNRHADCTVEDFNDVSKSGDYCMYHALLSF